MAITTYTDISDAGLIEGQIYSDEAYTVIRTGYNAESSAILPAGFALCKGTSSVVLDRTRVPLILPVDSSSVFMGISLLPHNIEKRTSYSVNSDSRYGYPVDYEVAFVTRGTIAVVVDDTVAIGDAVYWRHTASGSERVGMFRNDADTSDAVQVGTIATCRFVSAAVGTAAAPAIALVSINIA